MNMQPSRRLSRFALWFSLAPWRARLPGLIIAALLAFAANGLAGGLGDPLARNPLLVAMLLGLIIGNAFGCPERLRPGLQFTTRYVLRLAVVLVGFRITARLLVDLGAGPVLIAAAELCLVLLGVFWIAHKVFKLDREFSLLLAAGSAICGAAAILSVASLSRIRTQQAAIAITVITLFGTVALFLYPVAFLGGYLPGLDDDRYGIFVGASIYELAQVYGAGFAISELALNTATLVKLTKVLMLIPLLLALGYFMRRSQRKSDTVASFPWFVLGFVAVMLFNSAITLPGPLRAVIQQVDLFLFTMVMIALGLDTQFSRLGEAGGVWRLAGAGIVGLVFTTGVTYVLVRYALPAIPGANVSSSRNERAGPSASSPGERIFLATGCGKCHVPSLAADDHPVTLYSDLLLHDMGPALDDKIIQGEASGRDWRTAPLSGLGLRSRYLHDGRATTLYQAIAIHGGEAEIVRDRFLALNPDEQKALYQFLNSL
jgi:uncharacterized integral membrane protein (TIGR00698 family)